MTAAGQLEKHAIAMLSWGPACSGRQSVPNDPCGWSGRARSEPPSASECLGRRSGGKSIRYHMRLHCMNLLLRHLLFGICFAKWPSSGTFCCHQRLYRHEIPITAGASVWKAALALFYIISRMARHRQFFQPCKNDLGPFAALAASDRRITRLSTWKAEPRRQIGRPSASLTVCSLMLMPPLSRRSLALPFPIPRGSPYKAPSKRGGDYHPLGNGRMEDKARMIRARAFPVRHLQRFQKVAVGCPSSNHLQPLCRRR